MYFVSNKNFMKLTQTFLFLILFTPFSYAQEPTFDWVGSFAGESIDVAYSITTDADGNSYTTGYFQGTVDFDPGPGVFELEANGIADDVFITKLNNLGELVWAKSVGSHNSSDRANDIELDSEGNIIVVGSFYGTADFDPGPDEHMLTTHGATDLFCLKLDSDGNFVWAKSVGEYGLDNAQSVSIDEDDAIYLGGEYIYELDFDPGVGTHIAGDPTTSGLFIEKLSSEGDFEWVKTFGNEYNEYVRSVHVNPEGVFVSGNFAGSMDFDPGAGVESHSTAFGMELTFLQKFDHDGNWEWVKILESDNENDVYEISSDSEHNIYLAGTYYLSTDFDPGPGVENLTGTGYNTYVLKLDYDGNYIWVKEIVSPNMNIPYSLELDAENNVYVGGIFFESTDFDPGPDTHILTTEFPSLDDCYLFKLDPSGNFEWAHSFESVEVQRIWSISVNNDDIYFTGIHEGLVDLDPSDSTHYLEDVYGAQIYICKWNQCLPSYGIDTIISCESYMWIDGITYYESNDTASFSLINEDGCDSIVTLNLTIEETVAPEISLEESTLISDITAYSYQWLDCDDNYTEIDGATNYYYEIVENGSYAVKYEQEVCIDTSTCFIIADLGITNTNLDQIQLFPNPSNGPITMILPQSSPMSITIYSSNGQVVFHRSEVSSSTVKVDLNIEPGLYSVEVIGSERTYISKLIMR